MKMNQLAQIVDGLNSGLADLIKKADTAEFSELVKLCRSFEETTVGQFVIFVDEFRKSVDRYPGGNAKEFAKFVAAMVDLKSKYPNKSEKNIAKAVQQAFLTVEDVVQRITMFHQNANESETELIADLQLLSAPKVKDVMKALELNAGSKAENVKQIKQYLQHGHPTVDINGKQQHSDLSQQSVEQAVQAYRRLQDQLRDLSWDRLDFEFKRISQHDEATLQEVARQLGFSTLTESKSSIVEGLLNSLKKQKRSLMQAEYV